MRARAAIVGMVVTAMVWPAGAAAGGGWDSLDFRRDHYLVGEVAEATGLFYTGALEGSGPIDGRTYHAYLLPGSATESGFGMIDPPAIPKGAIRLGALEIDPSVDPAHYEGPYARATLSFVVPDVPSGDYAIGFCDDPCEHGYVGWLAWGSIRIVHTEQEGALMAALDRAETERWRIRTDLRRAERNLDGLSAELGDARSELRLERIDAGTPSERIMTISAEQGRERVVVWWPVAAGLLAALALGGWVGVRRPRAYERIAVPDTVPEDLERLERV